VASQAGKLTFVPEPRTSFQQNSPSLRERHAAMTRAAILDAARALFHRQGFAGTAVRPIAEEAGVAVQTIYSTFGSKQGILLALVDTIREQTDAPALWDQIEDANDPLAILRLAARLRCQILQRCGDIVATFREGAASDREVALAYEEGQRRNRQGIARMCARLHAIGALRADLPVGRAVDQVAALFSAEVYEELTGQRSQWSATEYQQWLFERLRDAILPPRAHVTRQ
jgi:AcrR family transcriptional regulator